jgi:aldehyde:ferredoxin oxidoreductase
MLTLPKQGQGYNPQLPPLDTMLDEYYDARGWNADGRPSTATIERLRLR